MQSLTGKIRDTLKKPGRRYSILALVGLFALSPLGCSRDGSQPAEESASAPPSPSPALSSAHQAAEGKRTMGPFKVQVPAGWLEQQPSSSMRKAHFVLPKVEGDEVDAELIVFYFGMGQGGSVEANIERWIGQFGQPDGSSSKDKAKTSKKEADGFPITVVDVSGTYQASMMPGAPERHNSPGFRMLAAVVETSEGPWFFKLVGPQKTISHWAESFDQFLNSVKRT
ncbi:MAG: hypothetical protein AB1898_07035 [Acidobacteriota bacterium]